MKSIGESLADRRTWHESYLRTYLQRDVLDLIRVERLAEFTRLIKLLAAQTGTLANQPALARDLGLPQPTVRRHIEWLRTTYQCHELPPYSTNLGKRLVKTPKLYWSDTGMAAARLMS
jgi:predicted AAA+ superfamily ATPase